MALCVPRVVGLYCARKYQITFAQGNALSERYLGIDAISFSFWMYVIEYGVGNLIPYFNCRILVPLPPFKWTCPSVNCEECAAPL